MKKRHGAEQIVGLLRQADVALGKGEKVPEVCKQLGISEQTYYRWRTKYGGWIRRWHVSCRSCRRRTRGSNAWWPTRRWTTRSCERPPAQLVSPSDGGGLRRLSAAAWGCSRYRNDGFAGCRGISLDAAYPSLEAGPRSTVDRGIPSVVRVVSAFW